MRTLALLGPTACGKSRLSLDLAARLTERGLAVEIVNADAMARYRGMDIGTAKVGAQERALVPHHQLDVLDVADEASVVDYQSAARADAQGVRRRGAVALYVGGSGLYLRAALDHLNVPPTDPALRARIEERLDRVGAEVLHAQLARADPDAAAAIAPANSRRVVRALEVVELTGRPFSASRPEPRHVVPTHQIGLTVDTGVLDERIARRARAMFDAGLLHEARELRERMGPTAAAAVGYRQAFAVLDGRADVAQAIADVALVTRRLAKRQRTWFRADPRTSWHDATDPGRFAALLDAVERDALTALDAGGAHTPARAIQGGP